jgi:hypothetical protein
MVWDTWIFAGVFFLSVEQDLKSAVAARADMRRANAKQRALQRESNAHQVNFAELKAAAYAAAKNRRQIKPSQQQQQKSLQRGGAQGMQNGNRPQHRGGEGAALQPVIVEYDQVTLERIVLPSYTWKDGRSAKHRPQISALVMYFRELILILPAVFFVHVPLQ